MAEKLITSLFSRGRTKEPPARKRPGKFYSVYVRDPAIITMLDSFKGKRRQRNKWLNELLRRVCVIKADLWPDLFGPDLAKRVGEKTELKVTAGFNGS